MAELDNGIYYKRGPNETNNERLVTDSLIRDIESQAQSRRPDDDRLFPKRYGYGPKVQPTIYEIAVITDEYDPMNYLRSSGRNWF